MLPFRGNFLATFTCFADFLANRANFADYSGYADRSDCAAGCALRGDPTKPLAVDAQNAKQQRKPPTRNVAFARRPLDGGANADAFTQPWRDGPDGSPKDRKSTR